MLYNLIGDPHGRDVWKKLVREDAINVFLGDYLDPYPSDNLQAGVDDWGNLQEILKYKQTHANTVLLLGNHDLHYIWHEHYSRYNVMHAAKYEEFFLRHWSEFQAAYAIGNNILVTHAGVSPDWCKIAGIPIDGELEVNAQKLAERICEYVNDRNRWHWLMTKYTFGLYDTCGMSSTASPVWIRPQALISTMDVQNPAFMRITQVVGHTQTNEIFQAENLVFIDCLGKTCSSLIIDVAEDGSYTLTIHQPEQ